MPAALQSTVDRLSGALKQFSLVQRVFALIAIAAVVIIGFAVYSWATKPTMTPLFSGLSGTDASAVVDQLATDGVQYQLTDGGATVMVPTASVYAERIKLAAAGLPSNSDGTGYSLLDKLSATSTEFQQQTTYQRAMEGELAKTVKAMDGIDAATVKLAIPKDSVFSDQKTDPTASVFIREKAGATIDANQVQAIVHLVSAGIPGMKTTDVSVVDANGKVLSTVGATSGAMSDQQTGDYESKLEAAVHELLDPLVGAGNVTVTASALLNYDQSQKTIESYQADPTAMPLASSTKTEEYTGTGSGSATGVLGPDNIAVPNGTGAAGTGDGSYKSSSQDLTNAVGKTTEVTTAAPGAVQRQSLAVAIDATAGAALDMTAVQSAITAAAGIDTARGDTLSVQRMPFDTTAATQAQAALAAADKEAAAAKTQSLIKDGAIGAVVLLVFIALLVMGARRSRRAKREALDLGRLQASSAEQDQARLDAVDAANLVEIEAPRSREGEAIESKRRQVAALAEDQPGEVADLLRGWLSESGSRR
ncbi:MAG: flagellar M-ring protein FliF [Cellulomonas sp.]|nr:flagellar M-ring protein FliF [Cellulomonas sp.]